MLEKGWLGGGNTGRNTTVIRSNYLWDESAALYEHSLKLWEGLAQELNYNLMFSQRGVLNLIHNVHDLQEATRRVNANRLNAVDAELLSAGRGQGVLPDPQHRGRRPATRSWAAPCSGAAATPATMPSPGATPGRPTPAASTSSRTARSPASTWMAGRVTGVQTTQGTIAARKVGIVVAGHSSVLAAMAGFRLPIESHPLQALVSEPLKPVLHCVIMSNGVHVYVSQSDKGELVIGAGLDPPNSYGQRGGLHTIEDQMGALVELIPIFSRVRMMRSWAGIVDVCPDASPIIGKTPVDGLYINGGWGTGGFKATPGSGWVLAHTIATGEPHPLNAPFALDRFTSGTLIDEHAAAAVAH